MSGWLPKAGTFGTSAATMSPFAFVTLLTTDGYLPGAQCLARSLRAAACQQPLVVLVTSNLQPETIYALKKDGCIEHVVESFLPDGEDPSNYKLACYADCWNKLWMWTLESYKRLVYLDADMVVTRNVEHLFELPDGFHAVRDCYNGRLTKEERDSCPYLGGPDYFNAGMFVMTPSRNTFQHFKKFLASQAAPVGAYAEQDFLNMHFRDSWQRLPYTFNVQKGLKFHHPELWLPEDFAIIHYVDSKPWHRDDPRNEPFEELVDLWWSIYEDADKSPAFSAAMRNVPPALPATPGNVPPALPVTPETVPPALPSTPENVPPPMAAKSPCAPPTLPAARHVTP